MFYDQLIIDVKNFSHPGTKNTIQIWINKDISEIFPLKNHSFNASLMLINLTIGRKS